MEHGISLAATSRFARKPGIRRTGGLERCSYKLLLVALLICSSRADDADEDHHPIMMACELEIGVVSLRYGWFVGPRWEVGKGWASDRIEGVAGGSDSYRAI